MAKPGPFDLSGTANSLADAIRRQAASQGAVGGGLFAKKAAKRSRAIRQTQAPSVDPFSALLEQVQNIRMEATPLDQLRQQAEGAAGAEYDPLIAELRGEMGRTKKRGTSNKKEARSMYNALASDIVKELPQITQQMANASKETEDRYNQTQEALQGQYQQQAQEQAQLFKQLGIQAAAPEASQQAMEDQAYFQNQSELDETNALQMLKEMKNTDISYGRETAQNTRLAGENTAQDIGAQLEEYLQAAGSKLGGLKAGKQSAISSMLAQLQSQDAQRMQQAEQQEFERRMQMARIQMDMQKMQQDAMFKSMQLSNRGGGGSGSDSLFKGTSGLSGAANYLAEQYGSGDSYSSKAIMDQINSVLSHPNVTAGRYQSDMKDAYGNPKSVPVNNEYLIDLLRKQMMEGDPNKPLSNPSFSGADINNAINALMAYKGKLR